MPVLLYSQLILGTALATIAGYQLSIGSRTVRPRPHIIFAAAALCAAIESFGGVTRYSAASVDSYLLATKICSTFQVLFAVCLVWFVVVHLPDSRRWIPMAFSLWATGILVVHWWLPTSLLFRETPVLVTHILPWGERIVTGVGSPNRLILAGNLCILLMMGYLIWGIAKIWRGGDRILAKRLAISFAPIVFLAYPHGLLVNWNVLPPPQFYGLAFVCLVLLMNQTLVQEAARAVELDRRVSAEQRRWISLLENVDLLIVSRDVKERLTYCNPAYLRVSGYSMQEIAGTSFEKAVSKQDLGKVREWFSGLIRGDTAPHGSEFEMVTRTGDTRRVLWSSVGLYEVDGSPAGVISVGTDVTEARATERERDQALARLRKLQEKIEAENLYLKEEVEQTLGHSRIVGQSSGIQYVLKKIQKVAPTTATVLIEGETGVGKELVARAIHDASERARGPFVRVNCAALPATLIESELFGHERGAFTGADRQRKGRFELAEGGTLFLDEIGELPLDMQVKLLRVLQEGEYERVGNSTTRHSDVRIVSASNRDLRSEVAAGRFREDLFYRLQVYPITVPPLRERREDIPMLVAEFVRRASAKYGKKIVEIPGHVLAELKERSWPGNVRELLNAVERAVITTNGEVLTLPTDLESRSARQADEFQAEELVSLACAERSYILKVLNHTGGKIAGRGGAAEILGMHPNTLRARMDKLGILKRPDRETFRTLA